MKNELSQEQIGYYQENGFVVIDDFLSPEELQEWREAVTEAIAERNGIKIPGQDIKVGMDDGISDGQFRFSRPLTGCYFWCPPVSGGKLDLTVLGLQA